MPKQAVTLALLLGVLVGPWASGLSAQDKKDPRYKNAKVLILAPIAGSTVAVIPLTLLVLDSGLQPDSLMIDRKHALRWADSLIAEALEERGSEVTWILPAQLRRVARQGIGLVPDPDQLGTSILAAQKFVDVPVGLQSRLHSLVSVAGGRYALIPAALAFSPAPSGGVDAMLTIVMTDIKTGRVVYRSEAPGSASSYASALRSAMATVLPVDTSNQ